MAERGTNPDGIHDGHRGRVFAKYRAVGANCLSDYERLEIMLYPIIPRGDTCYFALRLLEKFGSLKAILAADYTQLAEVEGIGESLAAELSLLSELSKMVYGDVIDQSSVIIERDGGLDSSNLKGRMKNERTDFGFTEC